MTAFYQARSIGTRRASLGESPFWHPAEQALYYCDIPGRQLRRFNPATVREDSWDFAADVGCCAPIESGGVLLARRDGVFRFFPDTNVAELIVESPCPDWSIERFNDGKCDAAGRFWCGTVYEPKSAPLASLYCLDRGVLHRRAGSVTTSNGIAWSPDRRTMYLSDTPAHTVFALSYDEETGNIGERRVFKRFAVRDMTEPIEAYEGRPDGAAVDSQGNYWVAMYEGGRLLQLSTAGDVLREVILPVQCPTMPCFGGPDLKTLYITSASAKRPQAELAAQPLAGCVLAMAVETPGLPCGYYRP